MSAWSILLRLLLSITLVLNGATAAASTHMHGEQAMPAPAVAVAAGEDMPCHEHQQMRASAQHELPAAPVDLATFHKAKHPAPDCCKSSACRCACVHAAQAALPAAFIAPFLVDHVDGVRRLPLGHVAPALPHLTRPPIG